MAASVRQERGHQPVATLLSPSRFTARCGESSQAEAEQGHAQRLRHVHWRKNAVRFQRGVDPAEAGAGERLHGYFQLSGIAHRCQRTGVDRVRTELGVAVTDIGAATDGDRGRAHEEGKGFVAGIGTGDVAQAEGQLGPVEIFECRVEGVRGDRKVEGVAGRTTGGDGLVAGVMDLVDDSGTCRGGKSECDCGHAEFHELFHFLSLVLIDHNSIE